MSEEMRQKMAAYRERKEDAARRDEDALESIRWEFTCRILEDYPAAEFRWIAPNGPPSLEVQVRLGDYGWSYRFGKHLFDAPGHELNMAISEMLRRMSIDPLRHMFAD